MIFFSGIWYSFFTRRRKSSIYVYHFFISLISYWGSSQEKSTGYQAYLQKPRVKGALREIIIQVEGNAFASLKRSCSFEPTQWSIIIHCVCAVISFGIWETNGNIKKIGTTLYIVQIFSKKYNKKIPSLFLGLYF